MLKATIIGNIGGDAEMRYSANGAPFLRFNVASNYRSRTVEGEWEDKTEWVRVTALGQRAESIGQYLRKGTRIYAEGRLEARPWTDQQGQVRSGLELIANASDLEFMSPRNDEQGGSAPQQQRQPAAAAAGRAAAPRQASLADDDLEDLPF